MADEAGHDRLQPGVGRLRHTVQHILGHLPLDIVAHGLATPSSLTVIPAPSGPAISSTPGSAGTAAAGEPKNTTCPTSRPPAECTSHCSRSAGFPRASTEPSVASRPFKK